MSVLVNLIQASWPNNYLIGRTFEEAPVVGDEIHYDTAGKSIDGIWKVERRMWCDGGKAVDVYCLKVK